MAAAVAAIVVAANASDGAYFSQSWGWVALAFLIPSTLLVIFDRVSVPGRLRIAFASLMGALGVWIALSTIWSISLPASAREVERMLVYVVRRARHRSRPPPRRRAGVSRRGIRRV